MSSPATSNSSATTNSSAISNSSRSRRWLRRVLVTVLGLLVVHGLAVFLIAKRVEKLEREHAERGEVLDMASFIPPELPPGTVNATDFTEAAAVLTRGHATVRLAIVESKPLPEDLGKLRARLRELDQTRASPTGADLELFRQTVERFQLALTVLDRGRAATEARYETNYDDVPAAILIPNLLARLGFARLLRARALVALDEGRNADAWDDAAFIFRLAHWTVSEAPWLIGDLVARAIALQATELVHTLMAVAPPTPEVSSRLIEEARRDDPRELFEVALAAEKASLFATLTADPERLAQLRDEDLEPEAVGWFLPYRPWLQLNAIAYLDAALPAFAVCLLPNYQQEDPAERLEASRPPGWAHLAKAYFFDCLEASHKRDHWLATLDLMELSFELAAAHEAAGSYPETLGRLGGEPRIDPFSGQPYHYRRTDAGYVLYSVSLNRSDDGGAPPPPRENGGPDLSRGDIVWEGAGLRPPKPGGGR